ncbi:MAG: acetoin utilization protein AcuC [Deltaproteobacteria bacterium]|nr:acetoin utilization protein AcuC [Deltaproteobacteria bacterium]
MPPLLIYTDEYQRFDYGPYHPLQVKRLQWTVTLMEAYGLLAKRKTRMVTTRQATEAEALTYHTWDYLQILKQINSGSKGEELASYGIGPGDNPAFPGVLDWGLFCAGGALQAGEWVVSGQGPVAFHLAGGMHHAHKSSAAGFCYLNDPVLVILYLRSLGKRVAYIDIDAHHGDGVQEAFYHSREVLTISFHQNGRTLFPSTGFVSEMGAGPGTGYSVNVPLHPWTDDAIFSWAFDQIVPSLLQVFRPDVIVTQLGVDTFYNDPLANLSLTSKSFCHAVRFFKGLKIPWVALGGGGYHLVNVARAWTLAWSIMLGRELGQEKLPPDFQELIRPLNFNEEWLRDEDYQEQEPNWQRANVEAKGVVRAIQEAIFPFFNIFGYGQWM